VEFHTAEITERKKKKQRRWTVLVTIAALVLTILFILIAFLAVVGKTRAPISVPHRAVLCSSMCSLQLVETIPSGMEYSPGSPSHPAIVDNLKEILTSATKTIDIASSYWTLKGSDVDGGPYPMAKVGEEIFEGLIEAATKRGVQIRIVHQVLCKNGSCMYPTNDTDTLKKIAGIEVRTLDVHRLVGSGIIHTKLWVVDGEHIYLGSANMDWRSFTEVKELGLVTKNCSCLASDMIKIFEAYWVLAQETSQVPAVWPPSFDTNINKANPLALTMNNMTTNVYFSSSPPQFCPSNRTVDIDAIVHIIKTADKFIDIAVMDYLAAVIYSGPHTYWPVIDNAIRQAAYDRGVQVRMLMSNWLHTKKEMIPMLKSLQDFGKACKSGNISVKLFTVPPGKMDIPFTRVNHNKYMVTDKTAYIGTSNWSGDYFIHTAGIGYIVYQETVNKPLHGLPIQDQLRLVFERDWNSKFSSSL